MSPPCIAFRVYASSVHMLLHVHVHSCVSLPCVCLSVCMSLRVCLFACISLRLYVRIYLLRAPVSFMCMSFHVYILQCIFLCVYVSSVHMSSVCMSLCKYASSMRCFLRVHVPYLVACIYHSMYMSLRVYLSSWIYLPLCPLLAHVSLWLYVSLCIYAAPCISLHIYIPPYVCLFRAHISFMCMYSYVNVAPCVSPSVCIMLRV